jgi:8-oxo-dGTP pyrophosphatase MutT (NUDIX family)
VSERDVIVRAAGAVLVREGLVAIVHRPKYDDWTLPKGKLEPGEDDAGAAVREVLEETGFDGVIESDLGTIAYEVERGGRTLPKVVRYYVMHAVGGSFTADAEVDELRWLGRDEAMGLLTYARDRDVLSRWPGPGDDRA